MSYSLTRQYRPVSTLETAGNDPLSVRAMNHAADQINNGHANAFAFLQRSQICFPPSSFSNIVDEDTAERVISGGVLLGGFVPAGYNYFRYRIGHYITTTDEAHTVAWKLYSSEFSYAGGPELFEVGRLGSHHSITWTSNSTTHAIFSGRVLAIIRDSRGFTNFTITGTPTSNGVVASLTTIGILAQP